MVISALHVIMGRDGSGRGAAKIAQLRDNANYFRRRLLELGYNVLGDFDSPVMVSGLGGWWSGLRLGVRREECWIRMLARVLGRWLAGAWCSPRRLTHPPTPTSPPLHRAPSLPPAPAPCSR